MDERTSTPEFNRNRERLGLRIQNLFGLGEEVQGRYSDRSRLDLILIATKGNIPAPVPGKQLHQLFRARRGKHTEKPDVVYEVIARLYPNLIKLEMFARKPRPGWRTWGSEVEVTEAPRTAPAQPSASPSSEPNTKPTSDGRVVQ